VFAGHPVQRNVFICYIVLQVLGFRPFPEQ
jgi:hypothetical protein